MMRPDLWCGALAGIMLAVGFVAPGQAADADKPTLSKTLHLFNWDNYLAPAVREDFERETGVRVIESRFASNEDMMAKLQLGGAAYDVAVPSDYAVRILIRQKLLAPLDHRNLPNLRHVAPRFRTPSYDPGLEYSVPYLWGTTGLGYSRKVFSAPPSGWGDVFDSAKLKRYSGRISMLNDMRETIGAALIYRGHSPNTTDPAQLQEARDVLLAQKAHIAKYDSEAYEDSLLAGETVLAHGWSGELFAIQKESKDVGFVVPKEGSFLFVDNLVIPKGARNKYTAEVFINFLLRPDVAAKNSNLLRYPTPNQAAWSLIDSRLEGARYQLPSGIRFHSIEDLGEAGRLYEKVWTEVKAQ